MDKFHHKLPKEVLKRHAREVSKTLVSSDYKHKRVDDPTAISEKQEKKVRLYVKEYLDKAVVKYHEHEEKKKKADRDGHGHGHDDEHKKGGSHMGVDASDETPGGTQPADEDALMSDGPSSPTTTNNNNNNNNNKRKRVSGVDEEMLDAASLTPEAESTTVKRLKESPEESSPPPPPPPPPDAMTPSQVEAFSRAEEEAQRLADEAEQDRIRQEEALQRENEEAMRDFELEQEAAAASASNGTTHLNGDGTLADEAVVIGRRKEVIIGQ